MKEPKEFSGDRLAYREWRESLHAYVTAHDPLLVQVLLEVESFGRTPLKEGDVEDMAEDFYLNAEDLVECKNVLYPGAISLSASARPCQCR